MYIAGVGVFCRLGRCCFQSSQQLFHFYMYYFLWLHFDLILCGLRLTNLISIILSQVQLPRGTNLQAENPICITSTFQTYMILGLGMKLLFCSCPMRDPFLYCSPNKAVRPECDTDSQCGSIEKDAVREIVDLSTVKLFSLKNTDLCTADNFVLAAALHLKLNIILHLNSLPYYSYFFLLTLY